MKNNPVYYVTYFPLGLGKLPQTNPMPVHHIVKIIEEFDSTRTLKFTSNENSTVTIKVRRIVILQLVLCNVCDAILHTNVPIWDFLFGSKKITQLTALQ